MASNDSLDRALAARYAWRHARPDETPSVDDEVGEAAPVDEADPALALREMRSLERHRAAAREECKRFAEAIDRTWRLVDPGLQARAAEQLARHAAALGLRVAAMNAHPLQAVRLLRLVARHYGRIDDDARDALVQCVVWLELDHPEVVELAVDLVTSEADELMQQVLFHLSAAGPWRSERVAAAWSAPLAALVERDDLPWAQRLASLSFLELAPSREAAPALRRLLRAPHLGVRAISLAALRAMGPDALSDDDATFLLRDLLVHELPDFLRGATFEHALAYARSLTELVVDLLPACAEAVLTELVASRAGSSGAWGIADSLWALRTLAAALPERALPLVDDWLTHSRDLDRLAAAEALARLPLALARPRLLLAAADGAPEVALRAHELWRERVGAQCPVDALAGVSVGLLDAPPSESFHGRLMVLRGRPLEARGRMAEALLAEAPSREALCLLVFALGADDLWRHNERAALPADATGWVRALLERFGPAGVEAVAELAARRSLLAPNGWFQALAKALPTLVAPRPDLSPLRPLGLRALREGRYRFAQRDATQVLRATGVDRALADECLAAIDAADDGLAASHAADLLAAIEADADLDARVAASFESALQEGNFERLGHLARVGAERAIAAIEARLAAMFETPGAMADLPFEAVRWLGGAARELVARGRLSRAWIDRALDPDRALRDDPRAARDAARRYQLACLLVRAERDDAHTAAMQRQLAPGGAFSPETAALAANALLFHRKLAWSDALLGPLAASVDDALRVPLLHHALYHEQPIDALWGAFAPLFASRDPAVVSRLARLVEDYPDGLGAHLRALPAGAIADAGLASVVAATLDPPDDEPYWQDD